VPALGDLPAVKSIQRYATLFWLYGAPLILAAMLLGNGHLFFAIVALLFLGWAWPATALALFLADRGWFKPATHLLQHPGAVGKHLLSGVYRLDPPNAPDFLTSLMVERPISGLALPGYVFFRFDIEPNHRAVAHETRHTLDMALLGPLFAVVYLAHSAWLALRWVGGASVSPYRDNFLERRARRHSGDFS